MVDQTYLLHGIQKKEDEDEDEEEEDADKKRNMAFWNKVGKPS